MRRLRFTAPGLVRRERSVPGNGQVKSSSDESGGAYDPRGRLRTDVDMMSTAEETRTSAGVEMIRAERARQVAVEGYTPEHDAEHGHGQLARAAACYALPSGHRPTRGALADGRGDDRGDRYRQVPLGWPWHPDFWKPGDRLRELAKAGALIAAEIDRLTAEQAPPGPRLACPGCGSPDVDLNRGLLCEPCTAITEAEGGGDGQRG
jgi:hypothetical protein